MLFLFCFFGVLLFSVAVFALYDIYVGTRAHTYMHEQVKDTHAYMHTHTHKHTRTHTQIYACTHARARAHTHTHTKEEDEGEEKKKRIQGLEQGIEGS